MTNRCILLYSLSRQHQVFHFNFECLIVFPRRRPFARPANEPHKNNDSDCGQAAVVKFGPIRYDMGKSRRVRLVASQRER